MKARKRLRFWRRKPKPATHIGIQLRISIPGAGPILEASSDHLYYIARYGGAPEPCRPDCLPDCKKHGWFDVLGGPDMRFVQADNPGLSIEIRPVNLPDYRLDS